MAQAVTYGYRGTILYIDLTTRQVHREPFTEDLARNYIGATGVNSRLALDLIPPGADPLGPENAVIIGAGPFAGTILPGACRTEITAKSPETYLIGLTNSGIFGPQMKYAGYDHIVLLGASETPVYIRIEDDRVHIEDATPIWGRDVYEATDWLWERHGNGYDVICIGPAGENLVRCANLIGNKHSAFGMCGIGAVLGSKRVKAVMCRGTGDVRVYDPPRFMGLAREVFKELDRHPYVLEWRKWGTLIQFQEYAPGAREQMEALGFDMEAWSKAYETSRFGVNTCPQCPVGCKMNVRIHSGRHAGLHLVASCPNGGMTSPYAFGLKVPTERYEDAVWLYSLANRLGLGAINFSALVAAAFRMYEAGLITLEDTGGVALRWGDADAVAQMMYKVARREDIGEVLADGVPRVLQEFPEARPFLPYVKKGEPIPFKPTDWPHQSWPKKPGDRFRWETTSMGFIVNPSGHLYTRYSSVTQMPNRKPDALRRYAERVGVPAEEMERVVFDRVDGYDPALITLYTELYHLVGFSLSNCNRPYFHRIFDVRRLEKLYRACTGIPLTFEEMRDCALRIITVQRLFNLKHGLTKEDDLYPPGWMGNPEDEDLLPRLVEQYYLAHGWDENGVPTPELLRRLGLEEEASALPRR